MCIRFNFSQNSSQAAVIEIKGVIFDMDGTLTIPVLNFNQMRERLGLSKDQDILPTVQGFPPQERAKAMAIIEEFEEEGVRLMKVCLLTSAVTETAGFIIKPSMCVTNLVN